MSDMFSTQSLIGLTKEAAKDLAEKNGYTIRVMNEDGQAFMGTMDIRSDRINLSISGGKVVEAKVG